jgi:UDP-glucose 4-epimerase
MRSLEHSRALVTGGAGLIGSTIVDGLVQAGAGEVLVLDDLSRGRRHHLAGALASGRVQLVEGDIRDRNLVATLTEGVDTVFHQAAIRITRCAAEPRLAVEVLVDGTFNVLEAAVASGVGRVVMASSASVYGQAEVLPTDERHHPWADDTIYGAAKTFGEGMLRSFHAMAGLEYVALRYFNVYGPRMDTHGRYTEVMIRWMEALEAGRAPLVQGDGSQTMDFVHVHDVARANLLAALTPFADDVYNVGTGRATSLVELCDGLGRAMGRPTEPTFGPARQANGVRHRCADVDHAARGLGFRSRIDLDEGLGSLVAWWRSQRVEVVA